MPSEILRSRPRPLWRRVARRARDTWRRGLTVVDPLLRAGTDEPLPPADLRLYYYRTLRPEAYRRASEGARTELVTRGLLPHHRVLDVGSGIGNLARGLFDYLHGGYDGIEIHPGAVAWCQQAITPRYPTFRFHRADVSSGAYNPSGGQGAAVYRFPFADGTFDFVFLGSVFTHMLPDEVAHYLREIRRVLVPSGTCVASYFLLNPDTLTGVEAGRSFLTFDVPHPSGTCRLHDAGRPEAAVALDEAFVRRAHEDAGLRITQVRRGDWWIGVSDDQDLVTAIAAGERASRIPA